MDDPGGGVCGSGAGNPPSPLTIIPFGGDPIIPMPFMGPMPFIPMPFIPPGMGGPVGTPPGYPGIPPMRGDIIPGNGIPGAIIPS